MISSQEVNSYSIFLNPVNMVKIWHTEMKEYFYISVYRKMGDPIIDQDIYFRAHPDPAMCQEDTAPENKANKDSCIKWEPKMCNDNKDCVIPRGMC